MVMLPLMLLTGCSDLPIPEVIRGLQIVAIESIPAEPAPSLFDPMTLKVWVADGQGVGADVLVWVCTPVAPPEGSAPADGAVRCAEAYLPGSIEGLPLSIFSRVGFVDGQSGPSYFASDNNWPLGVSILDSQYVLPPDLRGKMIVGALACAPGICPIMDAVAIDPQPGSDAWSDAMGTLADLAARGARSFLAGQDEFLPPEVSDIERDRAAWLYALPSGQVSLAAKYVPVYLPDLIRDTGVETEEDTASEPADPNRAPVLTLLSELRPRDRVAQLGLSDPDGDVLDVRTFVTAGGVTSAYDTGVEVLWHEPSDLRRPADLFVVAEDGRGGTAVWQWGEQAASCSTSAFVAALGTPNSPIEAGDALPLTSDVATFIGTNVRLGVTVPWYVTRAPAIVSGTLSLSVGGNNIVSYSLGSSQLSDNLGACRSTWGPTRMTLQMPRAQACTFAGSLAILELEMHVIDEDGDEVERATSEVQVVLTAGDSAGCDQP